MPEKFKKMTVFAPAKVNLHLTVKNRRKDGFHNLESIFLAVDWGDTLIFTPLEGKNTVEITMKTEKKEKKVAATFFGNGSCYLFPIEGNQNGSSYHFPAIPIEKNIVFKALSLFREKTGFSDGLDITIEKRIPIGGGLGGGSSNAAAALLALNKIAANPLGFDTLLEMGAVLGSDVPFFLHQTTVAWVTGRGEHIKPLETPCLFLVLVNPGFSSSTSEAFRLLDGFRNASQGGVEVGEGAEFFGSAEVLKDAKFLNDRFFNDFLPVFGEKEKLIYNQIICRLRELGADFASLSGAGSTCFGIFGSKEQAQKAAEVLRSEWEFVQYCCTYKSVI